MMEQDLKIPVKTCVHGRPYNIVSICEECCKNIASRAATASLPLSDKNIGYIPGRLEGNLVVGENYEIRGLETMRYIGECFYEEEEKYVFEGLLHGLSRVCLDDILRHIPKKQKIMRWGHITQICGEFSCEFYPTETIASKAISSISYACVPVTIEFTEGEGL